MRSLLLTHSFTLTFPPHSHTPHPTPHPQKHCIYPMNTHQLELEVIKFFSPLYGLEENNQWGIITNSGTDGNAHGIYFGRKYMQVVRLLFVAVCLCCCLRVHLSLSLSLPLHATPLLCHCTSQVVRLRRLFVVVAVAVAVADSDSDSDSVTVSHHPPFQTPPHHSPHTHP